MKPSILAAGGKFVIHGGRGIPFEDAEVREGEEDLIG
jgi:hypothetical protein